MLCFPAWEIHSNYTNTAPSQQAHLFRFPMEPTRWSPAPSGPPYSWAEVWPRHLWRADLRPAPFGTSIGYGRGAEGEAIAPGEPTPHSHPYDLSRRVDVWTPERGQVISEPSHEFPGSGGALSPEVNICPKHTQSNAARGSRCKDKAGNQTNDVRPCQQCSRAWQWTLTSLQDVFSQSSAKCWGRFRFTFQSDRISP